MPNNQQIANTFNTIADIINTGLAIGDMLGLTGGNDHGVENTNKLIFVYTRDNNGGYKLLGKEDGITAYLKYKENKPLESTETYELEYFPQYKAFRFSKVYLTPQADPNDYDSYILITDNHRGGYANRIIDFSDLQNSIANNYQGGNGIWQNQSNNDSLFDFIDDYGNKYVELRQDVNNQSIGSMVGEQIGQDLSGQIDPIALAALDVQLQAGLITQQEYNQAIANLQANAAANSLDLDFSGYLGNTSSNNQNTQTQPAGNNNQTQPANTHTQPPANTNTQPAGNNNTQSTNNNYSFWAGGQTNTNNQSNHNNNTTPYTPPPTKQAGFPVWLKLLFGGMAARTVYKMFFKKTKTTK